MLYLTMHSTHLDMVKDHSVRNETCCAHMSYSFQLAAEVTLYGQTDRAISHSSQCSTGVTKDILSMG